MRITHVLAAGAVALSLSACIGPGYDDGYGYSYHGRPLVDRYDRPAYGYHDRSDFEGRVFSGRSAREYDRSAGRSYGSTYDGRSAAEIRRDVEKRIQMQRDLSSLH